MIATKPFCTPIQKDELISQVTTFARDFCETSETLEEESDRIVQKISEILGVLREEIKNKMTVTKQCGQQSTDAVHEMSTEQEEIFRSEIEKLKEEVCAKISLILHKNYIEGIIGLIGEHCRSNMPPKRWGMGALSKWTGPDGEPWGKAFYNFWRNNLEKTGDEKFIREILPHFPKRWRNNFETKELNFCPHDWSELYEEGNYEEMVKILMSLERGIDPSKRRWGMGGLSKWTDPDGKQWGGSFYNFWHRNIDNAGDEKFKELLLPHFPESWQKNYKIRGYRICFKPDTDEIIEKASATDNINVLYKLADEEGNRKAFEKLTQVIAEKLTADTSQQIDIEEEEIDIIERCIHFYLESCGDLLSYCRSRISIYNYIKKREKRHNPQAESSVTPSEILFSGFEFLVGALEELGLDPDILIGLMEKIEAGDSLEEIVQTSEDEDTKKLAKIIHEFLSEQVEKRYYQP